MPVLRTSERIIPGLELRQFSWQADADKKPEVILLRVLRVARLAAQIDDGVWVLLSPYAPSGDDKGNAIKGYIL